RGGAGRASGVDRPGVASPGTAGTIAVQTLATRETSPRLRATARTSPRGRAPLEGAQSGTCTGDPQARECALAGARAARGGWRRTDDYDRQAVVVGGSLGGVEDRLLSDAADRWCPGLHAVRERRIRAGVEVLDRRHAYAGGLVVDRADAVEVGRAAKPGVGARD